MNPSPNVLCLFCGKWYLDETDDLSKDCPTESCKLERKRTERAFEKLDEASPGWERAFD